MSYLSAGTRFVRIALKVNNEQNKKCHIFCSLSVKLIQLLIVNFKAYKCWQLRFATSYKWPSFSTNTVFLGNGTDQITLTRMLLFKWLNIYCLFCNHIEKNLTVCLLRVHIYTAYLKKSNFKLYFLRGVVRAIIFQ